MRVTRLKVRIGSQEVELSELSYQDPDVALLVNAATSTSAVIVIEVPTEPEYAAAIGRLKFCSDPHNPNTSQEISSELKLLSTRIQDLDFKSILRGPNGCKYTPLSVATITKNRFTDKGMVYLWEIVQMTWVNVRKIHGLGPKSQRLLRAFLDHHNLMLDMRLSESMLLQLPRNNT